MAHQTYALGTYTVPIIVYHSIHQENEAPIFTI